jgi:F-type H+-transporting ATPase subunit epsilon
MHLRILVPSEIFADQAGVLRIVAETGAGSLGLLPHRLDCVANLVPGILTYQTKEGKTVYLAVDEGVMVKAGADVLISVRQAIGGTDLAGLHDAVKREFLTFDEQEKSVRSAVAKMESGFIGRFAELQRKNGHR